MHQRPTLNEVVISSEMTRITLKKVRELGNVIRLAFIFFFLLSQATSFQHLCVVRTQKNRDEEIDPKQHLNQKQGLLHSIEPR